MPDAAFISMKSAAARVGELPTDRPIVVMCGAGGRSEVVAKVLLGLGLDAVNLARGVRAWVAESARL